MMMNTLVYVAVKHKRVCTRVATGNRTDTSLHPVPIVRPEEHPRIRTSSIPFTGFLAKKIPAIPAIELSERTPQIDKQAFVPGHD
jgi:hypothetical protein